MDETCAWLEKLIHWVDRCGVPPIPFAGSAGGGFYNPPRPHLEIAYLKEGPIEDLRVGQRRVIFPKDHVALLNVHQGNFTSRFHKLESWAVFLEVGREAEFRLLETTPLFCLLPWPRAEAARLKAVFERLSLHCQRYGSGPRSYLKPDPLYHPLRDRRIGLVGRMRLKAALLDLLTMLLEEASRDLTRPALPPALREAVEFMLLEYADPGLDLEAVARAAGLSPDHFGRQFRLHLGQTPLQFLRQTRIRQARFLLAHTGLQVEQVAYSVGFKDPFHFSRVFTALAGSAPSRYREAKGASRRR